MIFKLVRHGESEANVQQVNTTEIGDINIGLTTKGFSQARVAGVELGATFILGSLIYTSPLLRTKQTTLGIIDGSNAIVHGSIPRIYEDPRLREVSFGYNKNSIDIMTEKEFREKHSYFLYRYNGGDSPADVYDRVATFMETMWRQIKKKKPKGVLIVSHGITIRCFVARFLHLTIDEFDKIDNPQNCDVITIARLGNRHMALPQFRTSRWGVMGLRWR